MRIAEPAARSMVLGCFAAAALGAFRVKSVSAKLFVWRGVLLAALAMPLLGWVAPSIRVPVPAPAFATHTFVKQAAVPSAADESVAIRTAAPIAAPRQNGSFGRSRAPNCAEQTTEIFDGSRAV